MLLLCARADTECVTIGNAVFYIVVVVGYVCLLRINHVRYTSGDNIIKNKI
ncbi:ORF-14 [Agrotis segetum nucleopolyhedrovirus A]|uniref:ORF-14 n=1 Tax=Agrotis segetum nuclear polyhedrosis virus TaxID=1962501 RepID=Q287Q8_NPVAS|nr:ORF-14 [Agrotis segetum nucleopolyhedrovirus A]AAZ38180.1 ORF-14 [Agrotis segetum nucleopolyhedrovirus A]